MTTPARLNLEFKNSVTEPPPHGLEITYVEQYSHYAEFKYGRIEYSWEDEDGYSESYDPEHPEPPDESCSLKILVVGGNDMGEDIPVFWWIPNETIDELLEKYEDT